MNIDKSTSLFQEQIWTPQSEQLFTIIVVRIASSQYLLEEQQNIITKIVIKYQGILIQNTQTTFAAIFQAPSKAFYCCLELKKDLNAKLAIGLHMMEAKIEEILFIEGKAKKFVDRFLAQVGFGQIVITYPVKYLISGMHLEFREQNSVLETLEGGSTTLIEVIQTGIHTQTDLSQEQKNEKPSILVQVKQCINIHISDRDFTVETICRELGISERQLQRKLKKFNKSPYQLIFHARMNYARDLLTSGQYNVTEIAYKLGYACPSYFSRKFKKKFGTCPSAMVA